jgi:hypothetical protein
MEAADQIVTLVREQLAHFSDTKVMTRVSDLLVAPRLVSRRWDYGQSGEMFDCWIVLEHRESNTGIAYCSKGFGPKCPWGLLFLEGDEQVMSIGSDSAWYIKLEDAFRESWAYEGIE